MTELSRDDLLHLLATRHEMIEPICGGTLDKKAIEESLDVSRPTVDRAFRELEELGLLQSSGTTYELTRFGRLFCDRVDHQLAQIEEMVEFASILSHLPQSASIDERLLAGAEVIQTERHAPLTPISEVGRLVDNADRIKAYTNVILPHYVSFIHRRVLEEGMAATVILSEGVMERAFSEYTDEINALIDHERFSLVKSEESLPYGIIVIDDEIVGVAIRDENNHLRGALVNYSEEAIEWATEQLEALETDGIEYQFTRRTPDSRFEWAAKAPIYNEDA